MSNRVYLGDNLPILKTFDDASFDLIYVDPPFNTGKAQKRKEIKTVRSETGDRVGFQGQRYESRVVGEKSYVDVFDDYLAFLEPRIRQLSKVELRAARAPHPSCSRPLHAHARHLQLR